MPELLMDYLPIAVFIGVALVIGLALMIAPFLVAVRNPDPEKVSAYECGFNAFDDAHMKFDVRFYLVAILFIIFDLEVAFLFPWAVAFKEIGAFGFWSMMVFLGVLTIGFIYEWRKGALEWDRSRRQFRSSTSRARARVASLSLATAASPSCPTRLRTRASSSPPRMTSSTGRAPARSCG